MPTKTLRRFICGGEASPILWHGVRVPEYFERGRCLSALRRLDRKLGQRVRAVDLYAHPQLYRSLLHHFGSLDAARKAAGLKGPDLRRRWSKNAVLDEIRRLHAQGITITISSLLEHGRCDLVGAVERYCKGFPRARALARIPDPKNEMTHREFWDADRIIDEIRERYSLGESLASSKAPLKLKDAARRYFGSWGEAIEAAGLNYDAIRLARTPYTRDELIRELKRLEKKHPDMTLTELHRQPMAFACIREFGSLEEAARAARLHQWPLRIRGPLLGKAVTLRTLRKWGNKRGLITWPDLKREDPRLYYSVHRHFDSLEQAGAAAHVRVQLLLRPPWTDHALRKALLSRRRAALPMNPTAIYEDDPGLYDALRRRYGALSRPDVARKLGLKPANSRWSRERVIAELQKIAGKRKLIAWTDPSPKLFAAARLHFGTWLAALREAGLRSLPRRPRRQL